YHQMYPAYERAKKEIPSENLVEIRYDEVAQNPLSTVRSIYDDLGLDGFEKMRPNLESYIQSQKDYKTNRHNLPDDLKVAINTHWKDYFDNYGYPIE
ncbi:MAG: sulfotransferase, partial [Pirellulaceae bacterium]|nr:sulfotransferase [Pirellulaceae bacterium]